MTLLAMLLAAVPAQAKPATATAADLRATLTSLLGEHVLLAASATGAALGGRQAQFEAVAASLDANSVDISKAIGSVYGADAESAFLTAWRGHIGFVVDYTTGLATKDQAKSDKAVQDLLGYSEAFGIFLNQANPNLPKDAVAAMVKEHILTLKAVIDAQAAGDQASAFNATRSAFGHMDMMAVALAGGIAKQFPDKFAGAADSPAASLRTTLTKLMQEHVYLAARATGAALGKRDAEFKAAAAALDSNSIDLAAAVGSVYGADAQAVFLGSWRSHISLVVDYTTGLATKDQAKADKAVQDLVNYTQAIGGLLNQVNPNLPKDAVAELVKMHILTLKDVIDAQAAGNQPLVYAKLRSAYAHMTMIADPLASAIVKQFPEKFGGAPAAPAGGPAMLPRTGGEGMPWTLYAVVVAALIGVGGLLAVRGRRVS
jgi:LPXTG-motif cell wall-anchored protein